MFPNAVNQIVEQTVPNGVGHAFGVKLNSDDLTVYRLETLHEAIFG